MINDSAANPLLEALVTVLRGDAPLQTYLHERAPAPDLFKRVYDEGTVPTDLTGRWLTIGGTTETWARWFHRSGSRLTPTLHIWHDPVEGDDVGKAVTYELWRLLGRALSAPLAVPGEHVMLVGSAELLDVQRDPSNAWHGIVRYLATTQRTSTT